MVLPWPPTELKKRPGLSIISVALCAGEGAAPGLCPPQDTGSTAQVPQEDAVNRQASTLLIAERRFRAMNTDGKSVVAVRPVQEFEPFFRLNCEEWLQGNRGMAPGK
jgi:hypothetical protein